MATSTLSPKTPGVYIEEISKFPPSVAAVETAIPAFIGFTASATEKDTDDLLNVPKRIISLLEYETYFGGSVNETGITVTLEETRDANDVRTSLEANATIAAPSAHIMHYAMQMYFSNGGGPCYVISVGLHDNVPADIPGALGGGLAVLATEDEPTLIVFPEVQLLASAADYYNLHIDALAQCESLKDRFAVMDIWRDADDTVDNIDVFRNAIGVNNLKYGAAYYPNLRTTLDYAHQDADVTLAHNVNGAPGDLDGDALDTVLGPNNENSDYYAAAKQAIGQLPVELPPVPGVMGAYAYVDSTRGVWKAPANVSLARVFGPAIKITDAQQEGLNVHSTGKSVNAIRAFAGKGTLIWGARTLAGNDNEWRYVPVRRFFNFVEESVKKATEPFVFEPNDANTWVKVRAMIENFLLLQWRAGALAGAKPEDAFFVKVGLGETMTALDILEGRMIVEIGMAAVRPAEFIILQFSHKMQVS